MLSFGCENVIATGENRDENW